MGNERQYFWVRWGDDWEIAINIYDEEEGGFIWILNGMQVISPPDEIGIMIVRESQKLSTSEGALHISDVVKSCPHCGEKVGYLNYKKHLYMSCVDE